MPPLENGGLEHKPQLSLRPFFRLRAKVRASPRFRSLRYLLGGRKVVRIAFGYHPKFSGSREAGSSTVVPLKL
jgi:hypothetical protein